MVEAFLFFCFICFLFFRKRLLVVAQGMHVVTVVVIVADIDGVSRKAHVVHYLDWDM